jgi:hypothetical protein
MPCQPVTLSPDKVNVTVQVETSVNVLTLVELLLEVVVEVVVVVLLEVAVLDVELELDEAVVVLVEELDVVVVDGAAWIASTYQNADSWTGPQLPVDVSVCGEEKS